MFIFLSSHACFLSNSFGDGEIQLRAFGPIYMHMQRYFAIRNGPFFLFGFTGYLCSYLQDFSCVNILSFQSPKLYVDKKSPKLLCYVVWDFIIRHVLKSRYMPFMKSVV